MGSIRLGLGLGLVVLALTIRGMFSTVDSRSSCVEAIWQREFILYHTLIKVVFTRLQCFESKGYSIFITFPISLSFSLLN